MMISTPSRASASTLSTTPPGLSRLSFSSVDDDSPSTLLAVEKTVSFGDIPLVGRNNSTQRLAGTKLFGSDGDDDRGIGGGVGGLHSRSRSSQQEEAADFIAPGRTTSDDAPGGAVAVAAAAAAPSPSSTWELNAEILRLRARLRRAEDEAASSLAELKSANDMIEQYREAVRTKNEIIRGLEGGGGGSPGQKRGGGARRSSSPPRPLGAGEPEKPCRHCGRTGGEDEKGKDKSGRLKLRSPNFLADEDDSGGGDGGGGGNAEEDDETTRRLRSLEAENEALRRREGELESRLAASWAETDTARSETADLRGRMARADAEIARIREASAARSAIDKEEIAKLSAGRIVQTSERNSEREMLRVQIKARDREIKALREQIEAAASQRRKVEMEEQKRRERAEEKRRERDAPWEMLSEAVTAGMELLCSTSNVVGEIDREFFCEQQRDDKAERGQRPV